ncbi:hypothetical protein OAU50_05040 [Planctomycetota bacterium]|nr:hypothetical protein [Planctomycetota bacterium]
MRFLPLCFLLLFLAACNDTGNEETTKTSARKSAQEAEVNLLKIRDASLEFWVKFGRPPAAMSDLTEFGMTEDTLNGEHYSDIAYGFGKLTFDDVGKLLAGYFWATSKGSSEADNVRMNGVTGEYDYVPSGQPFGSLKEEDRPTGSMPPDNG